MTKTGTSQRDYNFDSLKFILIFFVVLGHLIHSHLVDADRISFVVRCFICSFHMPLFIFTSGYFMKKATFQKVSKTTLGLLTTYLVFQSIYFLPLAIYKGKFDIINFFFEPAVGLWFIVALMFWRFLPPVLPSKNKAFIITLSFIISLASGYLIPHIELARTITFLPYFVIGYYVNSDTINKLRSMNKIVAMFILISVFILMFFFVNMEYHNTVNGSIPYYNSKFFSNIAPYEAMLYRLLTFVVAFVLSCVVLPLASLTTKTLAKYGDKTLYVYLLHPMLIGLLYYLFFYAYLGFRPNLLVDIISGVFITWVCLFLSNFKPVQYLVSPLDYIKKLKQSFAQKA